MAEVKGQYCLKPQLSPPAKEANHKQFTAWKGAASRAGGAGGGLPANVGGAPAPPESLRFGVVFEC